MLISMPQGTSTIFGAFQAILALLLETGRTSALAIKVARQEKFASEIFPLNLNVLALRTRRCAAK
jgi:hypothetical protein